MYECQYHSVNSYYNKYIKGFNYKLYINGKNRIPR